MSARTLPQGYNPPVPMHGRTLCTCRGLHIGGAFRPPMPQPTRDGEQLQAALLEPRTAQPLPPVQAVLGAIWRWC